MTEMNLEANDIKPPCDFIWQTALKRTRSSSYRSGK